MSFFSILLVLLAVTIVAYLLDATYRPPLFPGYPLGAAYLLTPSPPPSPIQGEGAEMCGHRIFIWQHSAPPQHRIDDLPCAAVEEVFGERRAQALAFLADPGTLAPEDSLSVRTRH